MKFTYSFLVLSIISLKVFSQDLAPSSVLGGNPLTIKWKYVQTKAVKVIFPVGNEKEALRVANIINFISDSAAVTVGPKRKHLDLLIQTNQVISNGYVGLSPYRSEYYATAFQDFNYLGAISWLDVLSFHEYRHALQYANARHGFTKFMYFIGGQGGWTLAQNFAVPNWYFEGDAVQTETVLSPAGRGRTPTFFQEQKSLLFNDRNYTYIKARNGSFKDLMPDHYRLGYAMLHQVRGEFGPDTWSKVLKDGSSYRSIIYPFSRALKRHTGYTTRKMYYRAYGELKKNWEEDLKSIELIPNTLITPEVKTVTNYVWPIQLSDNSIVCLKSSFKKIESLVQIKDGKETKLLTIGNTTEPYLSENNNKLAWSEMSTDIRRQNRNYNEIVSYDLTTHKKTKITHKTKLFSPQFDSKGDKIVAVSINEHIQHNIVFIDSKNGSELETIANPENDYVAYPHWTKDDADIVFIAKRNSEVALLKYNIASKNITELTPWTHHILSGISINNDVVYFSAAYSGVNNVFAVSLSGDKVIKQISSVKIGTYMPTVSADGKTLIASDFNYKGYKLTKQDINLATAKTIEIVAPLDQKNYRIVTTSTENNIIPKIPTQAFEVKDYKGPIRGEKLHTWGINSSLDAIGVKFRMDNILNDFGAGAAVSYNRNEGAFNYAANVDYSALFLPISLNGGLNDRATKVYSTSTPTDGDTTVTLKFRETIVGGNLALPLRWMYGAYNASFRLVGGLNHISTSNYKLGSESTDLNISNEYTVAEGGLFFSNIRNQAKQNVLPRFGQVISATVGQSVDNSEVLKYMATATLYLPGLFANHSLSFRGSWRQESLSNSYRFVDNFSHARGYTPILGDEEFVVSGNYQLPVIYPDFGFGGIAYFKRVRFNFFGDFSQVQRAAISKTYSQNSIGGELYFDVVVANLLPLSLGFRNSFLLDKDYFDANKESKFEFFMAGTF